MSTKHVLINVLVAVLFLIIGLLLGSAVAYSLLLPSNQQAQEELAAKQKIVQEMDVKIKKHQGTAMMS